MNWLTHGVYASQKRKKLRGVKSHQLNKVDIFSLLKSTKIIPGYKTDHSAIILTFTASLSKRGRGYWKFNYQLLRDVNYIQIVKSCITESIAEYYLSGDMDNYLNVKLKCSDQLFFEILKMKIRSSTISYSITKSKKEKIVYENIEKDIENLENKMNIQPSDYTDSLLRQKKTELEKKREEMVEGIL